MINFHDYFDYRDGLLYWKIKPSRNVKLGDEAGSFDSYGYRVVTMKKAGLNRVYQHQIVWIMHHGPIPEGMEIDHINHDRSDNRIENLRLVTVTQNKRNYTRLSVNTSGITGVCWHKSYGKWQVTIYDNDGKRVYLGRFAEFEEAVSVRRAAEVYYGYHENHGSEK